MLSIPEDIWTCIAQFISQEDLCQMMGVNSALFHLAMDTRYRTVSFQNLNDATMKKLQRLRDPAIASRIRCLYVNMSYKLDSYVTVRNWAYYEDSGEDNQDIYDTYLDHLIRAMVETISAFSNLTDFSLDWPLSSPSEKHLLPFLTAAWKNLGPRFRKVILKADLGNYHALLSTSGPLPMLQDLELALCDMTNDAHRSVYLDGVLAQIVAPFINNVAPTLRNLSLSSVSPQSLPPSSFTYSTQCDYSFLFSSVGTIPNLEKLVIQLQLNKDNFSDTGGLNRILHDHSATLCHFKWISALPWDWDMGDMSKKWMEACESDKSILANLRTLEIRTSSSRASFDLTVQLIKRSADTLTSLSLFGSYLSHHHVYQVLSVFAHRQAEERLEVLLLRVKHLSPELVLMIAKMLPYLRTLTLQILEVTEALQEWEEPEQWLESGAEEPPCIGDLPEKLRDNIIRSWRLWNVEIVKLGYTEMRLMNLLAECVPSIRNFGRIKSF